MDLDSIHWMTLYLVVGFVFLFPLHRSSFDMNHWHIQIYWLSLSRNKSCSHFQTRFRNRAQHQWQWGILSLVAMHHLRVAVEDVDEVGANKIDKHVAY